MVNQPIRNLLIWSDFTLGLSKVKRYFNGFGEFSFWWIQFASVLQCNRSSFSMSCTYFGVSYNKIKLKLLHLQYFL